MMQRRIAGLLLVAGGALAGQADEGAACSQAFKAFVAKHGRVYSTPEEALLRFGIFCSNLAFIEKENAKGLPYTLGVNELADQKPEEVSSRLGLGGPARAKPWVGLPLFGSSLLRRQVRPGRRHLLFTAMMQSRITGFLLVAGGALAGQPDDGAACSRAFKDFVAEHTRAYSTPEEALLRFGIFCSNLAYIEKENAKGLPYTLGVNELADQEPEEVSSRLGLSGPAKAKPWVGLPLLGTHRYSGAPLPASVDWSQKGAVTPPKNQAQCGSCWSFASTGAIEGAWEIATGKLVSLSEQQLVDCSKNGNMGCKGGAMDAAFTFIENQSACTEESYPYEAKDGVCRQSNCSVGIPAGGVQGYKDVPTQDMDALMEAVAQQPVAVAIEADQMAFQLYNKGILTQECGAKLDHGVLVVGYGTEGGVDYWKVKNSWGPQWGEAGYIRIKRGVPKDGECGIKDAPTYPVVGKPAAAGLQVMAELARRPGPQLGTRAAWEPRVTEEAT
eukprot:CAMPEP_0197943578 /NCGR_PEP_ID=MMETSP1439-20131203/124983_1 /TAXON_ID=66791 /ORGANISM="Gonyaulax spinifera, Strain CCMP409" /LENGTH=499 /DNA_ID=CAMNT_0043566833 /DNA_START=59 /DNA_END=1555 /DNA_ORIENTATION=-